MRKQILAFALCLFALTGCGRDGIEIDVTPLAEEIVSELLDETEGLDAEDFFEDAESDYMEDPKAEGRETETLSEFSSADVSDVDAIPDYTEYEFLELNGNYATFTEDDYSTEGYISLSELDSLGRCGVAMMNACSELLPTEERGQIGHIKPSGWHTIKYPDQISDRYLYNRCHLLMYALSGLNDDERNLITGTRFLNVSGMLTYEDMVLDYVKENPDNHVLYRVTPIFDGDNLVAKGVVMEAYSIEDEGELEFNVFCYNIQPGIELDYATGDSWVNESIAYPRDVK